MSDTPWTYVDVLLHSRNSSERKYCVPATAVEFSLGVKIVGLSLAVEEKTINYEQFGFVESVLPA